MPSTHNFSDIFISYSRRNKPFVERLEKALRQSPNIHEIWVDWEDIPQSVDWWAEIEAGIEGANTFLFILSPDSARSDVCRREIDHAVKSGKRIVPVVHIDVVDKQDQELIHPAIKRHNWILFKEEDDFELKLDEVIKVISTDVDYVNKHTRYFVRSKEWIQNEKENSFLLTGVEIDIAERWIKEAVEEKKQPEPDDLQRDYIHASRQRDQEEKQRLADLIAARKASEEQAQVALQEQKRAQQSSKRSLRLATIAGIATVIAIIVGSLAGMWALNAREEASIAETQVAIAGETLTPIPSTLTEVSENIITAIAERNIAETDVAIAAETLTPVPVTLDALATQVDEGYRFEMAGRAISRPNENTALAYIFEAIGKGTLSPAIQALAFDVLGTSRNRATLTGHNSPVTSVDVSPDGQIIASSGCSEMDSGFCFNGEIQLRDMATGEEIASLTGHEDYIISLKFSPDGRILASASLDLTIKLWDIETREEITTLIGHTNPVYDLSFTSDGKTIASGSADRSILLWDVETGTIINEILGHDDTVISVEFIPDSLILLSLSNDNVLKAWDLTDLSEILNIDVAEDVFDIAISPDLSIVVLAGFQKILVSDANQTNTSDDTSEFIGLPAHSTQINDITFSPDGRFIATASEDQTISIWDIVNQREIADLRGHTSGVNQAVFSPDSRSLISVSDDGTVRIWDIASGYEVTDIEPEQTIYSIAFSPDGKSYVTDSNDGGLIVRDTTTHQRLYNLPHGSEVWSVAYSPTGRMIASGSLDGTIKLWDVASGYEISSLTNHIFGVWALDFSPDGKMLASGGVDNTVRLWDVNTLEEITTLRGHSTAVRHIAFSPDGQYIASASFAGNITLWDVETQTEVNGFYDHQAVIWSVTFSPDSRKLLSSSEDQTIRVWDIETGTSIAILRGHASGVGSVDVSPDGKMIASGGDDGVIRFWDAETYEEIASIPAHQSTIWDVTFSPDGSLVASGGVGDNLHMWRSPSNLLQWIQENRYVRELSCRERIAFEIPVQCDADGNFPTRTPFPAPTVTATLLPDWTPFWTPAPTVTATPLPDWTPFWTPIPEPTMTPTPSLISENTQSAIIGDNEGELEVGWYDTWTYDGQEGEPLSIITIAEWDTVLTLYDESGNVLAENDDGGNLSNGNSEIDIVLPAEGTYVIEVSSFFDQYGGAYTLRLENFIQQQSD